MEKINVFFSFNQQGHSSFVKHVDWSEDSQVLRSNSADYEILYCEYLNLG